TAPTTRASRQLLQSRRVKQRSALSVFRNTRPGQRGLVRARLSRLCLARKVAYEVDEGARFGDEPAELPHGVFGVELRFGLGERPARHLAQARGDRVELKPLGELRMPEEVGVASPEPPHDLGLGCLDAESPVRLG